MDVLVLLYNAWIANGKAKKATTRKEQASWYSAKASYLALALKTSDKRIINKGIFRDEMTQQLCAFWHIRDIGCIAFHVCPERDTVIADPIAMLPMQAKPSMINPIKFWRENQNPQLH